MHRPIGRYRRSHRRIQPVMVGGAKPLYTSGFYARINILHLLSCLRMSVTAYSLYKPPDSDTCTAFLYHSYSTITAPFPSPFVTTISPYFTLASLHFLSSTSFPLLPCPHPASPRLPTRPIHAYTMPIQLHYIQLITYRLCYPRRRL